MKKTILIVTWLAFALKAQAQGTLQFSATLTGANEVPPNNDPTIATGTFSLDGNSLSFQVIVSAENFIAQNAYIQGPSLAGMNAPIIFDLGGPVFHSGPQGGSPYAVFFSPFTDPFGAGPFTLTDSQVNDLTSGLWYVNVTSSSFPNGQLRGQILEVSEPSLIALLGLGIIVIRYFTLARDRGGAKDNQNENRRHICIQGETAL